MVDLRLQELLICPVCHGELDFEEQWVVCQRCSARYPIEGQIPMMVPHVSNDGFGHDLYHAQLHGNYFEKVFHTNRTATLLRLIADELNVPPGVRALDVGCNTGPMLIPLRRRGYDVVGGGTVALATHIRDWFPNQAIAEHPAFANARGMLKYLRYVCEASSAA